MIAAPRLALLTVIACSCASPSPDPPFEYTATARWSSAETPDVTSLTIDGQPLASGVTYTIAETYSSYLAARSSAVRHPVIATTSTGTLTLYLAMLPWPCGTFVNEAAIANQTDEFALVPGSDGMPSFQAYTGSCHDSDGNTNQWSARTR